MAGFDTIFAVSWYFLLMLEAISCTDTPPVETTLGKIVGERVDVDTGNVSGIVDRFRGIPYVKPPVGRLRFANPEPHSGWGDTVREAKQFGPHCPQPDSRLLPYVHLGKTITDIRRDEDCLFLNVYVPRGVDVLRKTNASLAIIIFIHGGRFSAGSSATYNGDILALEGDVIVVSFNYRLGFLGFFSTGTDEAKGNNGLHDQHWAIKWVRENAEAFGGDPNRIIISGISAGAASVDLQMISPLNRGLIQGGISASGTVFAPWSLARSLNYSLKQAKSAGCGMSKPKTRLRCLRSKDAHELAQLGIDWRPMIDGHFLPKDPRDLLRENVTSGLRYMVGATSHDGSIYSLPLAGTPPTVARQLLLAKNFAFEEYEFSTESAAIAFARSILSEYGLIQDPMKALDLLTQATQQNTDFLFEMPAEESARRNDVGGATTYRYTLSVRLGYPTSYFPKAPFIRAEHFDTAIPFFGIFEEHPEIYNLTAEEWELSRSIRRYIANFAKNGDPNDGDPVSVKWPEYTASSRQFINLDTPTTVETFDRERQYLFVNVVLPAIVKVGKEVDEALALALKGKKRGTKGSKKGRSPRSLIGEHRFI